ncbi:MAG TPA: tyrosine-type recombinase/integrase [Vicinamibacterales bacterium]|nr:tyrosine-type recombinase/integrase [Vicinamibacterales bacterium]
MQKKLTARTVKSLKAVGQRTDYFDTAVPGLALRVSPTGAKSWALLYRTRNRLRRLTIGDAKTIGLADAREQARDAVRAAAKGGDPATEKKQRRGAKTIDDLIPDFIERHAKKRTRSWKHTQWLLTSRVLPKWRGRAIEDITRRDVRVLVEQIADRAPILANRAVAALSKMFRFALDDDLIAASPAVGVARPSPEHARDRVLTPEEIRTLWTKFKALSPALGAFFKLRLLTAQRGGEVASMRWQDVDLKTGWWTIPATVSKNKLAHRVPLTPSVVALLKTLRPTEPSATAYVLVGGRGKRQQTEAAATFGVQDFRGHDLRRTAASQMASGGVPRLTISKILNHVETGATAVYDRHSYDAEKQAALSWWDQQLRAILDERRQGADVRPFAKGARKPRRA